MNNVRPATHKIISYTEITSNAILANYNSLLDYDTCLNHGIDYNKLITQNNNSKIDKHIDVFQDVSVIIAALVTSFARVYLNNIILNVLNKGGNIYYMDTDSLVIDNKGFDILNDRKLIGKDIGQFKLEYEINKGYFISNKTYCLITNQTHNNTIIKAKGVTKNTLTVKNFQDLYNNININANRQNTVINYEQSYVDINNKNIILKHNSYLKRSKIHNSEGL